MELKEKKLGGETIYNGKILSLDVDEVLCPNGKKSKREVVRHCKAAAIIATIDGKFILEEQFRYPYEEIILEIPAGKCDPGEDLEECAKREFEEETGYKASTLIHLVDMYPSPAYTDEIISIYWAKDLSQGTVHLDDNEAINVKYLTFEEFKKAIEDGAIKDAKTLAAFGYYLLQNPALL